VSGDSERFGLAFAGLCALNAAFVTPVARLTTERGDPLFVATATTCIAGAAAAVVLAARGRLGALVRGPSALPLAVLGVLGTVLPNLLFFFGTARTSAIDAVLCLQIEPAYSLLLAWLVLGHRLTLRRVLSVGILLAGIGAAVGGGRVTDPVGVGLLLATPLCWQFSHLLVLRRVPDAPSHLLTGARYLWGGLWLGLATALFAAISGRPLLPEGASGEQIPALAYQGVVLFYVGTVLWYEALARLDLARATSIVVPSVPLLAFAAAFLVVGEVPSCRQLAALGLVAAGVLSFVRAPHAVETRERVPTQTAPLAAEIGDEEAGGEGA
jgi:drug/metabolite transporter (DMT)-like permease